MKKMLILLLLGTVSAVMAVEDYRNFFPEFEAENSWDQGVELRNDSGCLAIIKCHSTNSCYFQIKNNGEEIGLGADVTEGISESTLPIYESKETNHGSLGATYQKVMESGLLTVESSEDGTRIYSLETEKKIKEKKTNLLGFGFWKTIMDKRMSCSGLQIVD
ncbi:MAG: hypothetical protein KAQ98_05795 [Bacteriovoracaceae bacterium]|nr:hypothetical protein [Bacteriovoracaceae bacterium]